MKNLSFFAILIFFLLSNKLLNAQYTIGVSAGMTKAWENYGEVETPEDAELHIHGKYLTIKAYKDLKKNFQLGLEPSLTQKGARCVPGFIEFNSDTYLYLNYIDMPVLIKYNLNVFRGVLSIQGKGGYGPSFLINALRGFLPNDSTDEIGDI